MHSRIFNVTKNIENIIYENIISGDEMFDKMNGKADYVNENNDNLDKNVQWLLSSLIEEHEVEMFINKNDIKYIEIPYTIIREFIKNENANRLKNINTMLKEDMPKLKKYLRTGKAETVISILTYRIKNIIESETDFYIYVEGYGVMSLDNAISEFFENIKVDESVYIFQSFDYHF